MDMVGYFNHAGIISGIWIFDSNYEKSLTLIKELLGVIFSSSSSDYISDAFEIVYYSVVYVYTKSQKKLSE